MNLWRDEFRLWSQHLPLEKNQKPELAILPGTVATEETDHQDGTTEYNRYFRVLARDPTSRHPTWQSSGKTYTLKVITDGLVSKWSAENVPAGGCDPDLDQYGEDFVLTSSRGPHRRRRRE
jgi:hypothetical protein